MLPLDRWGIRRVGRRSAIIKIQKLRYVVAASLGALVSVAHGQFLYEPSYAPPSFSGAGAQCSYAIGPGGSIHGVLLDGTGWAPINKSLSASESADLAVFGLPDYAIAGSASSSLTNTAAATFFSLSVQSTSSFAGQFANTPGDSLLVAAGASNGTYFEVLESHWVHLTASASGTPMPTFADGWVGADSVQLYITRFGPGSDYPYLDLGGGDASLDQYIYMPAGSYMFSGGCNSSIDVFRTPQGTSTYSSSLTCSLTMTPTPPAGVVFALLWRRRRIKR